MNCRFTKVINKIKMNHLEIKLNINKIQQMSAPRLDADVETIEIEKLPENLNL